MPKRPTSRPAIVLKLLVDQLVFAPLSTILLFTALEAMKGTPEQIPANIQVNTAQLFLTPLVHKSMPQNHVC